MTLFRLCPYLLTTALLLWALLAAWVIGLAFVWVRQGIHA